MHIPSVDESVVLVKKTIPKEFKPMPEDNLILIDLEVTDGRGGIDQIGLALEYDPSGGKCQ